MQYSESVFEKDHRMRVATLSAVPNPQTCIWFARQDYIEGAVADLDPPKTEKEAGEWAIKALIKLSHWGPCEHPQIIFNVIGFPHSVMQQIRTHRTGVSFDCQCLAGDTEITILDKKGHKSYVKTIAELYDTWNNGEFHPKSKTGRRDGKKRLRKLRLRSLNEANNTFEINNLNEVIYSGLKPIYKVTLADGKAIKCTEDHKIFTPFGWRTLSQLDIGSKVMVNGVPLKNAGKTYQNKEFLKSEFDKGKRPKDIALMLGCSTEVVKKWAYHHNLTWDTRPWNTGKSGYKINISPEGKAVKQRHAREVLGKLHRPKGKDHPFWKNLPVEKQVYNWMKYERTKIFEQKGKFCSNCGSTDKLHIHHILKVKDYPEKAYDYDNLQVLCATCHNKHHKLGQDNKLHSHPVEIVSIEYLGIQKTYDLSMNAPNHNFVANGIVVHNSGRYTGKRVLKVAKGDLSVEDVFYYRPIGEYRDRKGKKYQYTESQKALDMSNDFIDCLRYSDLIQEGFSEEHARDCLPWSRIRQHFVLSCNLRALFHIFGMRSSKEAQQECQWCCDLLLEEALKWAPEIVGYYKEKKYGKSVIAP